MDNSNRPNVRAYIGATGSGKGVSVREYLKSLRAPRLLVWDPLSEYGGFCKTVTGSLPEVALAMKLPNFSISYWPGNDPKAYADKFDLFCRMAFAAGSCVVLVEELADVTSPSHAPPAWRRVTTQGRHRGLGVIACSQRPAQVDKQFLGGCTYIRCFTLRYPADRQAMAAVMDVPVQRVAELLTVETDTGTTINYLERDFREQKTNAGAIKLRRKKGRAT